MQFTFGLLVGILLFPTAMTITGHAKYIDLIFGKALCFVW